MLRCAYTDLDGTLLGPGGNLFLDGDKRPSLSAARAVEACARAGVELCIVTGRGRRAIAETARLLGQSSAVFEAGAGILLDGEVHWLTGEWQPGARTIHEQIADAGAPALLLEHFAGRLEEHLPWSVGRDVSHLLRGEVDTDEANALLAEHGFASLRLLDNGGVHRRSPALDPAIENVRAYHLVPSTVSKAAGVAFHRRARQYAREETLACGDSREDLQMAPAVGTFWLMANAIEHDASIRAAIGGAPNVRVAEAGHGAGVYEAVVTTLAARGGS